MYTSLMEILKSWMVQDFVARLSASIPFGTREAVQGTGYGKVTGILNEMKCVEIVHQSKPLVSGSSDKNIYSKLPDKDCSICSFERSGSSGCVIRRQDLRKIYEDSR